MEVTGKRRMMVGMGAQTAFCASVFLPSFFAFFLRDWRHLYLATSLFSLPCLVFQFVVVESPRWHFSNLRNEEGKKLTLRFARYNNRPITEDDWKKLDSQNNQCATNRKYSVLDILRPPKMRVITICICFSWFCMGMIFYGFTLSVGEVSGSIFLNNAMYGILPTASSIAIICTMDKIGRRVMLQVNLAVCGIFSTAIGIVDLLEEKTPAIQIFEQVACYIALTSISTAFNVAYISSVEIYPTVARSTGVGCASTCGGIGTIVAPLAISSTQCAPAVRYLVFAGLVFIAIPLTFYSPETRGVAMPQTIEGAEEFYSGKQRCSERQRLLSDETPREGG